MKQRKATWKKRLHKVDKMFFLKASNSFWDKQTSAKEEKKISIPVEEVHYLNGSSRKENRKNEGIKRN